MRGYEKRVFFLKSTDSKIFDEAFFLVKDEKAQLEIEEKDMISEANRIIEESLGGRQSRRKIFRGIKSVPFLFPFVLGTLFVTAIAVVGALLT